MYISDHGESLGENGVYLHGMPYSLAPREQTHVPMIMWMSDGFQTTVKSVKAYLKSDPKKQTFLYMNMGNEGLDDPYENSISMRNGYIDLAKFLEQNKSNHFRFESELMEQEYHASTIVVGTFYAFRTLYRKFPLPTATVKQGLSAILQHYKNLSDELDFEAFRLAEWESDLNAHIRLPLSPPAHGR